MTDATLDSHLEPDAPLHSELVRGLNTREMAVAVYALFMAAPFTAGLAAIGGVGIAYLARRQSSSVLRSHFAFQIRTFWVGLAIALAGAAVLAFSKLGIIGLAASGLYVMVRGAIGLSRALNNRPARAPHGLLG